MKDALRVGVPERAGHFAGQAQRLRDRKPPLAAEATPERLALDVRHDVVEPGQLGAKLEGARVVDRDDVRMLQLRGKMDLAQEPVASEQQRDPWLQDLDRN